MYQNVSGNSTVIAKVVNIEPTNANAVAGVMFRESLDPNSSFAALAVNPTGTLLMSRQGTNKPIYKGQNGSAPIWLKLVRSSNLFSASVSNDGVSWTSLWETTITMGSSIYVGLAVTSHDSTLINTSAFSNVSVIGSGNQFPGVSLTSPANNASFAAGSNISLAASASDSDGSISKVEFYQGPTKLGEDLSSPYSFAWNNVAAGTYQLTAKAFDNSAASTTSAIVNISVTSTDNCSASGSILREVWTNISGTGVSSIPVSTTPNISGQLTILEAPSNFDSNYGQRLRGYICAPESGNYIFWIASDDNSELWLSSDTDPSKKVKIASVGYYTGIREWTKYASQQSAPIALQAGKSYYIEALHKEGLYSDNLAVGWQLPNGTQERPIAGSRLSPFVSGISRIGDSLEEPQTNSELLAYPVPASKEINLEFSFPEEQQVRMDLYDMQGKLVDTLFEQRVGAGDKHRVVYQVADLADGVYLVRLAGKHAIRHQKIMIYNHYNTSVYLT